MVIGYGQQVSDCCCCGGGCGCCCFVSNNGYRYLLLTYCLENAPVAIAPTVYVYYLVTTIVLFPVPCVIVFILVNSTAWANESTAALPFGTIMVLVSLFVLGVAPLSVLGTVIGRNTSGDFEAPCRVHKVPRQVPAMPFYRSSLVHVLVGGFLPFSAVYIEMHYIFEAMWGHKIYTLFGILFLAICLVVLVTAFITIALTYFQLAVEDHRWWWRSLGSGGSIGLFVYAYCFYFYFHRTEMSGFLQTSTFFGYMGLICFAIFLALGFVGFYSSLFFVRFVYSSIHVD
jgi:transmembrane 9 superfamily protein 1